MNFAVKSGTLGRANKLKHVGHDCYIVASANKGKDKISQGELGSWEPILYRRRYSN